MLVCNVSQRARHIAIAADVAETAAVADSFGTGNIVFATLVDDPASVLDHVDAYSGEIMLEAASAASTVNAGLTYAAALVETAAAVDTATGSVPAILAATIVEAASAADAPDAVTAAPADVDSMVAGTSPVFAAVRAGQDSMVVPGAFVSG